MKGNVKDSVSFQHPDYDEKKPSWVKVRDCLEGEDRIKSKRETYLPRPSGMSGRYEKAYDAYIERAHFPLTVGFALQGALGIIVTKLPEFNVPKELEYILENSTKDGRSLSQLFLDVVIEAFLTGRVPLLVDVVPEKNEFRFVQYQAEDFINWKTSPYGETENSLILGVFEEEHEDPDAIYSQDTITKYRVLKYANGIYKSELHTVGSSGDKTPVIEERTPSLRGKPFTQIPLFNVGSINNSFDVQPIPLIAVANCSVQIYRKEADLANSEFLSCNPTLCITGANTKKELPNVVGSSVMIVLQNEQARVFYTKTDTAALSHVTNHIESLYDESIRHGVAVLDSRKGVEAAESLRIRQATQSASLYSIYLSAINAIQSGLKAMCKCGGYDESQIIADAPNSLSQGIPDSALVKALSDSCKEGTIPLSVIHKYLVDTGLISQTIGFHEYVELLEQERYDELVSKGRTNEEGESGSSVTKKEEELEGVEDQM
ncbi:MAG: DUF4055 domain-containing protein [Sphaerochaetaceae bacterium]